MGQQKKCLLCITENVKHSDDFLNKRAYFSVPKMQELRIKWNESITKIHPVLKGYVDNVNTYQICDLHFKESDIKKHYEIKSTDACTGKLPLSRWVLKIQALPMSSEELKNEKLKYSKSTVKLQNQIEKTTLNEKQEIQVKIEKQYQENQLQNYVDCNQVQEIKTSTSADELESEKNKLPEKEKAISAKLGPEFHKKIEMKYSPYSLLKSNNNNNAKVNILQIKSGKPAGQVIVVRSGAQVIPASLMNSISSVIKVAGNSSPGNPSSVINSSSPSPVSSSNQTILKQNPAKTSLQFQNWEKVNTPSKPIKVPVISQGSSLSANPSVTKLIPVTNVLSNPKSSLINSVFPLVKMPSNINGPIITKVCSIADVKKIPDKNQKVFSASKVVNCTTINDLPFKVHSSNIASNLKNTSAPSFSPQSSSSEIQVIEPYDNDKLKLDLQRYPLPRGWAYTLPNENKILFTQYSTFRKFPIFLLIEDNMTAMISCGHQTVKFISHEIELECFANVINGLHKLENLTWCIGIGFNNNKHSDLCSILTNRRFFRCEACILVRKNEQKRESDEIQRLHKLKKPQKNYKNVIRNLQRVNQRLEAKVCKMKLMVTHLKSKQCADCLHKNFVKRISTHAEFASHSALISE